MNNRYAVAFFLLFLTVSLCHAAWTDNFSSVYEKEGIDEAVKMAFADGAYPDQIIKTALSIEGLKQVVLVKALYCALAQPEAIREAAKNNHISDETIDSGYELAVQECGRQMEENLDTTIVQTQDFPELAPSNRIRRTIYPIENPLQGKGNEPVGNENPPKGKDYVSPWKF